MIRLKSINDIIQMKESLQLVRTKLVKLLDICKDFALKYKDMPTLGFTHYQPAQPFYRLAQAEVHPYWDCKQGRALPRLY